ncbi:hypothetical protein AGMMS49928_03950 [Spirochaetia bacterium]|nr:hypothetical protein AGMMS49928_03950 [Spirochaetia bacterium]
MRRILAIFLAGGLLAAVSCRENGALLRDGYYTAEAMEFDNFGWKEFVSISVNNGRITSVEYDAKNLSGFIKSWDMDYMRLMNAIDGTYPNEYTRFYGEQFLTKQDAAAVDALTGATTSYHSFKQLAAQVILNAQTGDAPVSLVRLTDQ